MAVLKFSFLFIFATICIKIYNMLNYYIFKLTIWFLFLFRGHHVPKTEPCYNCSIHEKQKMFLLLGIHLDSVCRVRTLAYNDQNYLN